METAYKQAYEASFRRQFAKPPPWPQSLWDDLVTEAVTIALQLERVTVRANRAWDVDGGILSDLGQKEMELTSRYHTALMNRWQSLLDKLNRADEDTVEYQERLQRFHPGVGRNDCHDRQS